MRPRPTGAFSRAPHIIGGSSVLNLFIGLARTKVAAILLGPAGIGLVGLYTSLLGTGTTVAGMGIGTAGTRQVAEAAGREDLPALAVARRALAWLAVALACAGALVVWALRDVLARAVLGSESHSGAVGWLALGVALSVLGAAQGALLRGMRRIKDMALVSVLSAVVNTAIGIAVLWRFGKSGLIAYVLIGPALVFLFGRVFTSRLPKPERTAIDRRTLAHQWKLLLGVGVAFMGSGVVTTLVQLWIRVEIRGHSGTEALGHYEAAWTIATQYLAFVLSAMGADYYPRLTGLIHDKFGATRLVNQQTEIAVLLSAPVIILMLGLAPWITTLLYSSAFSPAVAVVRWQMLGNVLQVASWPLGFVLIAAGDAKTYLLTQTASLLVMGGLISALIPVFGLPVTGVASLASYALLLPLVYLLARHRIGFAWTRKVTVLVAAVFLLCAGIAALSTVFKWGAFVSIGLSLVFGFYSLGCIAHSSDLKGPLGRAGAFAYGVSSKLGLHRH